MFGTDNSSHIVILLICRSFVVCFSQVAFIEFRNDAVRHLVYQAEEFAHYFFLIFGLIKSYLSLI